jgi:chromosome segregation ATPase
MLQKMQEKVEAEGEKEKELFEKFMCYCKNGVADLEKSIAEAEEMITELPGKIEEGKAELAQTKADIKKDKEDRTAAKMAMEEATGIREKEAGIFDKTSNEFKTNLAAMKKAIGALEAGLGGAFLQTESASQLKELVQNDAHITDIDRDDLTAFLAGGDSHGEGMQGAGEIVGILKQMQDTMTTDLADMTATEKTALAEYEKLMEAQTKQVDVLTKSIEEKIERVGKLGEDIVAMEEDLSDAEEGFEKDKKFLEDLKSGCETKEKEWDVRCKMRQEEILALSDTIKILNDDDALEMFKKTLPGDESFLQLQVSQGQMRAQATAILSAARNSKKAERQRLDMILMAIRGKKVGFDKVLKLIDNMVALMGKEQEDDDAKKEYCEAEFDKADDKMKGLTREDGKLEKAIGEAKEVIKDTAEEIKALAEGIVALDKSVAEATDNRKEENSDYKTLMANNGAAKEIMLFAKNRLNKFYNPKLYKPPAEGFAQVSHHDAPPPPPETFGAYSKQSESGGGVIAMIDTLIKELDTEMTEAETEEKLAQEEYDEFMADSKEKRAADSKSVADKETMKGDTEDQLTKLSDTHKDVLMEIMATDEVITNLHGQCDWLLKYYDTRKEARAGEVDALKKAKAVLNGADFSFVQMRTVRFLHRA